MRRFSMYLREEERFDDHWRHHEIVQGEWRDHEQDVPNQRYATHVVGQWVKYVVDACDYKYVYGQR